jgi:CHAP domain
MAASESLALMLADQASDVLANVKETRYIHTQNVNAAIGVYDVDCSGFVSWILQQIALRHLQQIPFDDSAGRQLAHNYYQFFASRPVQAAQGWQQISGLANALKGDLVAWQLADNPHGGDTGHVFVVHATPVANPDGTLRIHVIDASDVKHFDDSRGTGPGQFATGVGSGFIHFQVDGDGNPTAFQFNANETPVTAPIAICRIQPLGSG